MAKLKTDRPTYTSDFIPSDTDRAVFLGNPLFDNMMTALISLGSEVWTTRRRVKVLESLLEDKGVTREMVEAYMPTEAENAEWQKERDAFIERTFGPLARAGDRPLGAGSEGSGS